MIFNQIQHETLRISIIQRLEYYLGLRRDGTSAEHTGVDDWEQDEAEETSVPFEPFKDLCKRRFLWYYESYLAAIEKGKTEVEENQPFKLMPFESSTRNGMSGTFQYQDLEKRLKRIKAELDEEPKKWAQDGMESALAESRVSVNLKHQFEHVLTSLKSGDMPHNIALEDGNPFVWILTYFGRPMTNFDSGVIRIKMHFSPRFPEEQPRVRLETKIFHHLVASDGTLCHGPIPGKSEDVRCLVDAIIMALEDDEPPYDPRKIVNLEANQLFWKGGPENKKLYHRRLRRSVQDSLE
jgi:ubiquitin-conjugating enzyme E2 Z